jgi:hypothetical protein
LENMPKRSAEVLPDLVSDSDSDSSVASEKLTPTKDAKKIKVDPSKLRPASELSAFLICRWYDKCKTFASTIKLANKRGHNLYNAAIARAIESERERKAKELKESTLSKKERDLKKQQEQQILNDATDLRGRKPVLDKESMELLHKAAKRERDRVTLIRPTRTDCEYLVDIVHWKQCKRIAGELRNISCMKIPTFQFVTGTEFLKKPSHDDAGTQFDFRTYDRIIDEVWPEQRSVDKKAQAREDAKNEIRNMISTAAVAEAEFANTNPEAIVSSDIFSIQINKRGEVELVYMAKGSKDLLKKFGLSPGHEEHSEGEAMRGAPIMISKTMGGHLISAIAIIVDSEITPKSLIDIRPLDHVGGDALDATIFVAYCGSEIHEEVLYHTMFKDVVFPKSQRWIEACKALRRAGNIKVAQQPEPPTSASDLSPSSQASVRSRSSINPIVVADDEVSQQSLQEGHIAVHADMDAIMQVDIGVSALTYDNHVQFNIEFEEWINVQCFDGDMPQVKATMNKEAMKAHGLKTLRSIALARGIRIVKWAAGCSMLFSPNDLSACFKLFRHLFKTVTFESCSVENADAWPVGVRVHHAFFNSLNIPPASKKAYWKLLANLPWIVDKVFVMKTIQDGWRLGGFFPKVDPLWILSKYSGWHDAEIMNDEQRDLVLKAHSKFVVIARKCGRVPDHEMEAELPFLQPVFSISHALEEMGYHRARCECWTKKDYFRDREAALQRRLQIEPGMKRTKLAAAPAPDRPAAILRHFLDPSWAVKEATIDDIKSQLNLRKISFKPQSAKQVLKSAWFEHDVKSPPLGFMTLFSTALQALQQATAAAAAAS